MTMTAVPSGRTSRAVSPQQAANPSRTLTRALPRACVRNVRKLIFLSTCLLAVSIFQGCVARFSNSERNVDGNFRKVYVPAVNDVSTRGGQAGRVSAAVRRAIALDTRFSMSSLQNARWALDVTIRDSVRQTTRFEECKQAGEVLAGDAYACTNVERNFNTPEVSAEEEALLLDVDVRAIDLNNGGTLAAKRYARVSSGAYNLVGDDDTRKMLAATPELHALRYVENADDAVARIGQTIAADILALLAGIDPAAAPAPAPASPALPR